MVYILAIETASTKCSVALSKNGENMAIKEDKSLNYSHAEMLHQFIEEVLAQSHLSINDLSAIAVSKGPGSYTGLRIGVSAAKGLCFALDIPLIAISTLEVLALQVVTSPNTYIVPMLDARRMEAYTAIYNSNFDLVRDVKAEILDKHSFEAVLAHQKALFIGSATSKFETVISNANAVFISDALPSAKDIGRLAFKQFEAGNTEDVAYFEPFYLKDFVSFKA